jgi:hypothetical protein
VDGKRFEVSTGKHTETDAQEELREFLRDPEATSRAAAPRARRST